MQVQSRLTTPAPTQSGMRPQGGGLRMPGQTLLPHTYGHSKWRTAAVAGGEHSRRHRVALRERHIAMPERLASLSFHHSARSQKTYMLGCAAKCKAHAQHIMLHGSAPASYAQHEGSGEKRPWTQPKPQRNSKDGDKDDDTHKGNGQHCCLWMTWMPHCDKSEAGL